MPIMDLRNLPANLSSADRCHERQRIIERELGVGLASTSVDADRLGQAEEKNCENMFGHVPLPVGLAGPLGVEFSSGDAREIYVPLATTEGALVASVNRGCKALQSVTVESEYVGISRSIAFKVGNWKLEIEHFLRFIREQEQQWRAIGEVTSGHLQILSYDIDVSDPYIFLTIACDTDEAMGMNMVTIVAQAIGNYLTEQIDGLELITVAGNVDSDKKPSVRTHKKGRGYTVMATATVERSVIESVLKTTPEALVEVAQAKLEHGSKLAGAMGANLHVANIVAALYLATGQDAAHVVEGSLADTNVILSSTKDDISLHVRLPAVLIGVRGGGTVLPAQRQCLNVLLQPETNLHVCRQLAESIGAAVLAGELSLLAAQAAQHLASAHRELGR